MNSKSDLKKEEKPFIELNGNDAEEEDYFNTKTRKTTSVDVIIGSRIRSIRLLLGFTQNALSELLGVTFQQVQKYEQGSNRISASKLWELAEKLSIRIENFFPSNSKMSVPKKLTVNEKHSDFQGGDLDWTKSPIIHSKEILHLIKAYNRITDQALKKKFLSLISSFSSSNKNNADS